MEGTNGWALGAVSRNAMRPQNYRGINVLQRGQSFQACSGNPRKCQKLVTENHGVGSSILPLGTIQDLFHQ